MIIILKLSRELICFLHSFHSTLNTIIDSECHLGLDITPHFPYWRRLKRTVDRNRPGWHGHNESRYQVHSSICSYSWSTEIALTTGLIIEMQCIKSRIYIFDLIWFGSQGLSADLKWIKRGFFQEWFPLTIVIHFIIKTEVCERIRSTDALDAQNEIARDHICALFPKLELRLIWSLLGLIRHFSYGSVASGKSKQFPLSIWIEWSGFATRMHIFVDCAGRAETV